MILIENTTTEFKQIYTDDVKKTVIAFANTSGGVLYLGVANNGEAVGLADINDIMSRAANAIRDSIKPDVTMALK